MRPTVAGGWRTVVAQGADRRTSPTASTRTRTAAVPGAEVVDRRHARGRSTARAALPVGTLEPPRGDLRRRRCCASSSTAPRSRSSPSTGSIATSTVAAAHRRQRRLGRVVQRPDRRGARLQPRAQRRRDPERHGPEHHARHGRADDHGADAGARLGGHQRRHARPTVALQRADERRQRSPSSTLPAEGRRRTPSSRRPSPTTPATSTATLTPQSALTYGATYTVTVKGGAGGVTDLAGNPLAADSTGRSRPRPRRRRSSSSARPANPFGSYLGEILRNEGLNAFTTIDVAFVSPALLAQFDVVVLGETPLTPAQVTALTGWVNGGGNLIAMRPDKQLAGLLGLTDAGTTLANAYLQVATGIGAGRRHRRQHDAVPRHRRPLHAERRHVGRDALLERDDRDVEPGRDAALGRLERRPGGGVHVRPRALGRLHAPGQPGLGGPGARRRRRASGPTTCSTAPRPATCSPTGSTRTRSRSRRPTSSSGCC